MTFIKKPDDALEYLKNHIDDLQNKLNGEIPSHQKLLDYSSILKNDIFKYSRETLSNSGIYVSYRYSSHDECKTIEQIEKRYNDLMKVLSSFDVQKNKIKDDNIVIIEHNKKVISKIRQFMKIVGISDTYSEIDSKSRARIPKHITKRAGYLQDIERVIKTTDYGLVSLENKVKTIKESLTKWYNNSIDKIKTENDIKLKQENKINHEKLLAVLKVKYNISFECEEDVIIETILSKCKYLKLAHYLLKNRMDWNDGPYYASIGIDGFVIETEEDSYILDEISSNLHEWDGDGRIFRDCKYSYDYLFSLVNEDLLKDYNSLISFIP